jgi:CheY-like chemotaxis protein
LAGILVVDDNVELRRGIGFMARLGGHVVREAGTIAEAMDRFAESLQGGPRIDIVISDVDVPDGLGTELHDELKPELGDRAFVLITGDLFEMHRQEYARLHGLPLYFKGTDRINLFLTSLRHNPIAALAS